MSNQRFSKENDDLRNSAGLVSRKEMKDLEERCTALETGNAELKKMVNISNVMAVRSAQASQKAAESKAEKDIFNSRTSNIPERS